MAKSGSRCSATDFLATLLIRLVFLLLVVLIASFGLKQTVGSHGRVGVAHDHLNRDGCACNLGGNGSVVLGLLALGTKAVLVGRRCLPHRASFAVALAQGTLDLQVD